MTAICNISKMRSAIWKDSSHDKPKDQARALKEINDRMLEYQGMIASHLSKSQVMMHVRIMHSLEFNAFMSIFSFPFFFA